MSQFEVDRHGAKGDGMTTRPITRPYEEVKWRLDGLKEQLENSCLDPELYDVLVALNNNGYFTASSCAGHTRGSRGCISFAGPRIFKGWQKEILIWLLQLHGLEGIKLKVGSGYTAATFAAIPGSQYGNGINDMWPPWEDADYGWDVPPKPDKCPACGKSDFWIQGEFYDIEDTLEWMCKNCQPLPFTTTYRGYQSPEIVKRRKELPKLKLWEVEDQETHRAFQMRAKNEYDLHKRLGMTQEDVFYKFFVKRVE